MYRFYFFHHTVPIQFSFLVDVDSLDVRVCNASQAKSGCKAPFFSSLSSALILDLC